jgi:hypothetical protein
MLPSTSGDFLNDSAGDELATMDYEERELIIILLSVCWNHIQRGCSAKSRLPTICYPNEQQGGGK